MYGTLGARRLTLLEGASIKALQGIFQKLFAFGAQVAVSVMTAAVHTYHHLDGSGFPG
jgi:hypothetical protein